MPHGATLMRFVEAALGDDAAQLAAARSAVRGALGEAAVVDLAATVASFNAVVKVADGTGIPLEPWKVERTQDIRQALSLDDFQT